MLRFQIKHALTRLAARPCRGTSGPNEARLVVRLFYDFAEKRYIVLLRLKFSPIERRRDSFDKKNVKTAAVVVFRLNTTSETTLTAFNYTYFRITHDFSRIKQVTKKTVYVVWK